jgi:predicted nucleic acid-binding protein
MAEETLVLDASVIVKWYSEEEDSDKALEIRDHFFKGKMKVLVPDLLFYEVANALRYNQVLSEDEITSAIEDLYEIGFERMIMDKSLLIKTVSLAMKSDISVYDASYVSLAEQTECKYITADLKVTEKCQDKNIILLSNWK